MALKFPPCSDPFNSHALCVRLGITCDLASVTPLKLGPLTLLCVMLPCYRLPMIVPSVKVEMRYVARVWSKVVCCLVLICRLMGRLVLGVLVVVMMRIIIYARLGLL